MSQTFLLEDGDVVVSPADGQPVMVRDGQKLRQDLGVAFATETRPNNIGAGLDAAVGLTGDQFRVQNVVSTRVRNTVRNLQALQREFIRDQRPDTELVASLLLVRVRPLQGSLTSYGVRIEVRTRDGGRTPVTMTLG